MDKKYKIGGMTCSACANRVERGIKKMEGMKDASVNFTTETLTVSFDENKVTSNEIEKKVEVLGYSVIKNIKTHTYRVEGMTCAVCAGRVEKVTKKIEGVQDSVVNLTTEKMSITVDDDIVTYGDIKRAVEKAGYKLADAELTMVPQNTTAVPAEKKEQFERLIDALEDDDDVSNVYTAAADEDE